ncbi:putative cysteine-rich receptor-like protein kinase 12 [Miscanthus floridulus]|uniref:putative cysteine-rich receptor-like protein kinase 12 n=1 Tax=Miscanthus floridulus TaxID=154761 RepID=UPI003459A838
MAISNYTYLKLKMLGPNGVVTMSSAFSHAFTCDRDHFELTTMVINSVELPRFVESSTPAIPDSNKPAPSMSFRPLEETSGYMAPECLCGSSISVKSDVFSFGVLILEIISGRKVGTSFRRYKRSENPIAFAWRLWEDENSKQLIDEEHDQETEILRCIQIALLCIQANPEDRPDMKEVVRILSNKGTQLDNPKQPAYFNEPIVSITSNPTSTQYLTAIHVHPA